MGPFRKSFKIFADSHHKRLSVKFSNLLLLPRLAFNYLLFLVIIPWLSSTINQYRVYSIEYRVKKEKEKKLKDIIV